MVSKQYDCMEKVQYKASRQFLQISQNTANTAAVGECGRYPIFVHQVLRCIKIWFQLVNMENHRHPKKCYLMLFHLDERGSSTWASYVKKKKKKKKKKAFSLWFWSCLVKSRCW